MALSRALRRRWTPRNLRVPAEGQADAPGSGSHIVRLRPPVPPDRAGEGGDRRREPPAGDRHQRDLADDLPVGGPPGEDAGDGRRNLRDKTDPEPGGDHHLDPILTLAAKAYLDCESM